MRFAFLMNLDGAAELARGTEVDPFAALERRPALRAPLAALATAEGIVLARGDDAHGLRGRAFLPTPGAIRALARAGADVPEAPSLAVLRAANHRRLALEIECAAASAFYTDAAAAAAYVRDHAGNGPFRLKRAFAFAGRGHLRVDGTTARATVEAFITRAVAHDGGVVVELELDEILCEAAIHGFIPHEGEPTIGQPTVQRVSPSGVWQESVLADATALRTREREVLQNVARAAVHALSDIGYHGPFGVDAYRYRHDGREGFRPISDLNARYTMGFAVGMRDRRPDLD